jgi:hypothetical protein
MRRLQAVDEEAVVADYEADVLVNDICASHNIGLVRLYRILDRHQVPSAERTEAAEATAATHPHRLSHRRPHRGDR